MRPIELLDVKDKDVLVTCILHGIRELSDISEHAQEWGCSKMEMQDQIARLRRILLDVSKAGE